MSSKTSQHMATPPTIAQRRRLRRSSGARTGRRAASLLSVIGTDLDLSFTWMIAKSVLAWYRSVSFVTEDASQRACNQRITASFQIYSCNRLRVISGPPDGLLGDGPTPEGGPLSDPERRFTGLYDQYYRRVLRYTLQHADQACAEDVASETFLIAWRRWPTFLSSRCHGCSA